MRLERTLPAPGVMLLVLCGVAAASIAAFMLVAARGDWGFLLPFRGSKVAAMVLVGYAVAVATVLFQTVSGNRILTPAIMGFDALYVLIKTGVVFFLGAGVLAGADGRVLFVAEVAVMVLFSVVLYRWLFSGGVRGLHLMMLVGIVLGVLFRALAAFMQRVLDPNDFLTVQDKLFASFNRPDTDLLAVSAVVVAVVSVLGWRSLRAWDVLILGRDSTTALGLDHRRQVTQVLLIVAVLVAVSTALVGPVTFLGLLVANLAYMLVPTHRHALVLPAAALIAITVLTLGQLILERVLAFDTALGIVIEFAGGLFFLFLLVRGAAR